MLDCDQSAAPADQAGQDRNPLHEARSEWLRSM